MTPKERVFAALKGKRPDRVPFTAYTGLFPRGETERRLRNEGVGLIERCRIHKIEHSRVEVERREYWQAGRPLVRETIHTPVGEVWRDRQPEAGYGTIRILDYFIKRPEDYGPVKFMIEDTIYRPDYDRYAVIEQNLGDDGVIMATIGYTPIQEMLVHLLGIERFGLDFYDHREEIDELYQIMREKHKELYQVVADSPVDIISYGDNITGELIGPERFRRYYLPCYNELARLLHKRGKILAVHMDGKLNCLKEAIAETEIDCIEAFTPPPVGDLSVKEALGLWKDKSLWINFTSSIHMARPEIIRDHTRALLREAAPGKRFIISITENVPDDFWQKSFSIISEVLKESAGK
jgi:uroporphyrinogen-III decarboxylase